MIERKKPSVRDLSLDSKRVERELKLPLDHPSTHNSNVVNPDTYIPPELQDMVLDYLGGACTGTLTDTKESEKFSFFHNESKLLANVAAYHAAHGKEAELEAMLKTNPGLLLLKSRVIDYSGRTIIGTPFQIALGAEDVEMCEMISSYFEKLPNGKKMKLEQYKQQFPNDEKEEDDSNDLVALKEVTNAIADFKKIDDCEKDLTEFRNYLDTKLKDVIKTGNHFNIQLLVAALKLYNKNYVCFGGLDSLRNTLYWRNVIGYIQRFLPACYAQAFCQRVYKLDPRYEGVYCHRQKLDRSLSFCNGRKQFFPLDLDLNDRLGFDYAAQLGQGVSGVLRRGGGGLGVGTWVLANYVNQKHQRCRSLCEEETNPSLARN